MSPIQILLAVAASLGILIFLYGVIIITFTLGKQINLACSPPPPAMDKAVEGTPNA